MAGTWKSFNAPSGVSADTMILLTDATVLVHDANRQGTKFGNFGGANWYRLTPDAQGDYSKGQWAGPFPMANARQFFASGVLRDGRVYVVGGEFSSATPLQDADPTGEIFDPTTNAWAPMTKPPSVNYIVGDCVSCVLADGRVLFGGAPGPYSNRGLESGDRRLDPGRDGFFHTARHESWPGQRGILVFAHQRQCSCGSDHRRDSRAEHRNVRLLD